MGALHTIVIPSSITNRMILGTDPDSGTMFRYTGSNYIDILPALSEVIESYPLFPDLEMNILDNWELVPADALESAKTTVEAAYLRWKQEIEEKLKEGGDRVSDREKNWQSCSASPRSRDGRWRGHLAAT